MKITLPERLAGMRDALFVLEVEFPVATESRTVEVKTEGAIEALDLRGTGPGGTYDVPVGLERLHVPMRVSENASGEATVVVTCSAGPEQGSTETHTLLLEPGTAASAGSRARGKLAVAAILVAVLGAAAVWVGPKLFGGDSVPTVAGLTESEAIARLQKAEYRYEVVMQDVEDHEKHGVVLRTIPAGGEAQDKGKRVQIVVGNAQERMVKVDSVVGQTEAAAAAALKAVGFQPVTQYVDARAGEEPGRVLRQSPDGGAHLERGQEVEIFVARPAVVPQPDTPQPDTPQPDTPQPDTPQPDTPQPDTPQPDTPQPDTPQPDTPQPDTPQPDTGLVRLPKLVGMTFIAAEKKLEGLGLLAIPEGKRVEDPGQADKVLAQYPEFDGSTPEFVAPGGQVYLTVGRYEKATTPVPDTPTPDTPTPDTPTPDTPTPDTPTPDTPTPDTPTPDTPTPDTPTPDTPTPDTPTPTAPGARVAVPDLIALSRARATGLVRSAGLWYRVQLEETGDVPDGQVLSQRPEAGEMLSRGATVDLVVARAPGAVGVVVPDVIGRSRADAERALRAEGFLVRATYGGGPLARVGTVSSQGPAAGQTAGRRTWVEIVVIGGSGPERGATGGAPPAALSGGNSGPAAPAGSGVLERAPTMGSGPVTRSAPTRRGAQPVPPVRLPGQDAAPTQVAPDLVAREAKAAIAAALEAGLIPIIENVRSGSGAPGAVVRQAPKAGAQAKAGALMRLGVRLPDQTAERHVSLPTALGGLLAKEREMLRAGGQRVEVIEIVAPGHPYAGTGRVAAQYPVSSVPRSLARTITLWVVR